MTLFQLLTYIKSNGRLNVNDESEGKWNRPWSVLGHYPRICLEREINLTKSLSLDNPTSGGDSNPKPPEQLSTRLQCSVLATDSPVFKS